MKDLSMRWLAGWSAATGHLWTDEGGVVRIEALMSSRRFEYLLIEPDERDMTAITGLIGGDSRDVVTVFTKKPEHYLVPHHGLVLDRDDEALMTRTLEATPSPIPAGYETRWEATGDLTNLLVLHGHELAACGNLALAGNDAVFDRIETMPKHRRHGLGRFVMQALTSRALENGADSGLLAASADGQLLYETLGWHNECAMLMFRGTVDAEI